MGLKEPGLRGSLRSVSTGVSAIPDSADNHWGFIEGSGTTVADQVGSFDADFTGLSWGTPGFEGQHGILDGTDDRADLGSESKSHWSHWVNDGEGFFAAWINPEDSDEATLFGNGLSSSNRAFDFRVGSDVRISAGDRSNSVNIFDINESNVFNTNEWQAIGIIADGSTVYLYRNDNEEHTDTVSNTQSGDLGDDNVQIGGEDDQGSGYFGGGVDQLWTAKNATVQDYLDWYNSTSDRFE